MGLLMKRIAIGVAVLFGSYVFLLAWSAKQSARLAEAFITSALFNDAVDACEKVETTNGVEFDYRHAKSKHVGGPTLLRSEVFSEGIAAYVLHADGRTCHFYPLGRYARVF